MNVTQWRMARKLGYRRLYLHQAVNTSWERFWTCEVLGEHLEKTGSHGRCHRCGKAM